MTNPDWNLIRSFVAVAETGSLSAAARQLSASQPTIGRHVAELEQALDVVLFRRGRKGFELSESGAVLYERARAMAEQATAFQRLATGSAEGIAGSVRITASAIISTYVLPAILARLAVIEPDIEVEIVASDRVENLLRRDADIAIRMVEPRQLDLVSRKIADLPLTACAARSYLDRRGTPTFVDDLLRHDLVGYDRGPELIEGFRAFGVSLGRNAFRFRSDDHTVMWEAVKAGNGIGFAQRALARREPSVEMILPDLPLPHLPMWLAMHRDVRTSRRLRMVANFLHDALKSYATD